MPTKQSRSRRSRDIQVPVAPGVLGQSSADIQTLHAGHDLNGGYALGELHRIGAAAAPDHGVIELHPPDVRGTISAIRENHRRRRYAMKLQQKIDRALEAYVRSNETAWRPDMDEDEREAIRKEVQKIIKSARTGASDDEALVTLVQTTDMTREPIDKMRSNAEKQMEKLVKSLPINAWIETVRGAGALGVATVFAEAAAVNPETGAISTLSDYPTPAKLWKRLGYAPYEGFAGSTWKRDKWRPRTLTSDEWKANPFSGQRYALMTQIVTWLVNAQWIGASKTEDGVGKPNGPYGEVYAKRRAHTAIAHPDWTKGHSHNDALRVTMKAFLKDLWEEWNLDTEPVPS